MDHRSRTILALTACLCVWNVKPVRGYVIDANKNNLTIRFHISFWGYGKIEGRFNRLRGKLNLNDKKPSDSSVRIEIDTGSINSNHKARDAYLRGPAFLSTRRYPKAFFVSSKFEPIDQNAVSIKGRLTLRGVTRAITVISRPIQANNGGGNSAFRGTTSFHLADFGINTFPSLFATKLFLTIRVDGVRRQ